jgi:hypothetical protein
MNFYIGWDVGTWKCTNGNKKSCDALVIMDEGTMLGHCRDNLSESISTVNANRDTKAATLLESWFSKCGVPTKPTDADRCFVAIDTPLGWPKGFVNLLKGELKKDWSFERTDKDIKNRLLFRKTERELASGFSAITHSIGNQSTKGMVVIRALEASQRSWGVWQKENITLIETYPKACLRSKAFVDWMLTQNLSRDVREWSNAGSKKRKKPWIKEQDDTFDAVVCACLARAFAGDSPKLVRPPDSDPDDEKSEGWIFYPAGHLIEASLADGYSEVTNSASVGSFGQAVKAFQDYVVSNEKAKAPQTVTST